MKYSKYHTSITLWHASTTYWPQVTKSASMASLVINHAYRKFPTSSSPGSCTIDVRQNYSVRQTGRKTTYGLLLFCTNRLFPCPWWGSCSSSSCFGCWYIGFVFTIKSYLSSQGLLLSQMLEDKRDLQIQIQEFEYWHWWRHPLCSCRVLHWFMLWAGS